MHEIVRNFIDEKIANIENGIRGAQSDITWAEDSILQAKKKIDNGNAALRELKALRDADKTYSIDELFDNLQSLWGAR